MRKLDVRSSKATSMLSLTGGLGNQLFQLAHAVVISGAQDIVFTEEFGRPRENEIGNAEIFSFELPLKYRRVDAPEANWIVRKILGHLLKISEQPTGIETHRSYRRVIRRLANAVATIHYCKPVNVLTKFDKLQNRQDKNAISLFVGYFQEIPHSSVEEVRVLLQNLQVLNPRPEFMVAKNYLETHAVTIVHIRLTDYFFEPGIGLLSPDYFELSLKKLLPSELGDEIWVFSDDIKLAKELLHISQDVPIKYISEDMFSVAETFELMRLGESYILSNSTFGWWAAFLSRRTNPTVIMPKPWFRTLRYSESLHLDEWRSEDASWENR